MSAIIYVVQGRKQAGGVWVYANRFEQVFTALGLDVLRHDLESADPEPVLSLWERNGRPPIHIEFSATSTQAFALLKNLSNHEQLRITGTVHDAPYLVWGAAAALYPAISQGRVMRKCLDLLLAHRIEVRLASRLAGIITLTDVGRHRMMKRVGEHCPEVRVIRHIETVSQSRKPAERRRGPVRLLFFGELRQDKGLDDLVTTVTELPADLLELHVVGAGPLREWFLAKYRSRPQAPKLVYHGALPDAQLGDLFADMDAAILPYRRVATSGASGALMHVMGAGLCAIVPSDETCLTEYITDGVTGLHYNRAELGAFLRASVAKVERLQQIGVRAQQWCAEHTRPAQLAKQLQGFFN